MPGKSSRAAFGEALLDLGAKDERIVTLDADLSKSTMTAKFAKAHPGRAFNVGIAESTMIGMAAGLALSGRVPFACSFACFLVGRFETIRVSVAYTQAPVKLVGTHVGVAIGEDGYTQMGLEDMACLRALPNIPIVQPADEIETKQAIAWAVEHPGPVYLRLTRQNLENVHGDGFRFQFGRAEVLRPGTDVSILATGGPLWNALDAAKRLESEGIHAEVLNVATIKPLDEEDILRSAGKTGHVVTVEEFGESGDQKGLYAKHGLDAAGITASVKKFLSR
jgi:transketolase